MYRRIAGAIRRSAAMDEQGRPYSGVNCPIADTLGIIGDRGSGDPVSLHFCRDSDSATVPAAAVCL
jgi:hypothetical protein